MRSMTARATTGRRDDLVVGHNDSVHQHFNADAHSPLMLLSGQNRLFKLLGYNAVVYLEDAPEYTRQPQAAGKARGGRIRV